MVIAFKVIFKSVVDLGQFLRARIQTRYNCIKWHFLQGPSIHFWVVVTIYCDSTEFLGFLSFVSIFGSKELKKLMRSRRTWVDFLANSWLLMGEVDRVKFAKKAICLDPS